MKKKTKSYSLPKIKPDAEDPAHRTGHRKMNLKSEFTTAAGSKTELKNETALHQLTKSDRIKKTNGYRRVPGAGN